MSLENIQVFFPAEFLYEVFLLKFFRNNSQDKAQKYYKDLYGTIIIVLKYTHLLCLHSLYVNGYVTFVYSDRKGRTSSVRHPISHFIQILNLPTKKKKRKNQSHSGNLNSDLISSVIQGSPELATWLNHIVLQAKCSCCAHAGDKRRCRDKRSYHLPNTIIMSQAPCPGLPTESLGWNRAWRGHQ